MSAKNFFNGGGNFIVNKSLSELTASAGIESVGVLSSSLERFDALLPNIDFSRPEEFAKFGSAEQYYEDSILNIARSYPLDGSRKQKAQWRNNASYLDIYLLDNEYPKATGSANIGTAFGSITAGASAIYTTPARVEYIYVPGGLASGSIYSESNRTSAFSFDVTKGFALEFFLRKNGDPAISGSSIILHATNGIATASAGNFTMKMYLTESTIGSLIYHGASSVNSISYTNATRITSSLWNHFCFNYRSGSSPSLDLWMNGVKVATTAISDGNWPAASTNLLLSGTIGAGLDPSLGGVLGCNKISASFDEFRFWRKSRTDREIITNWFSSVDGGYDDDELLNPDMAFYYKFNEGVTSTSSIDVRVLDYSGRKLHTLWTGYTSAARSTESPIENEVRDPVIYTATHLVTGLIAQKKLIGKNWDSQNPAMMLHNLPWHIVDEDTGHLAKLTQIVSSFFDRTWLQIKALTSLRDTTFFSSGSLSTEILKRAIESNGLAIGDLLDVATLREVIEQKSDTFLLEKSIDDIKRVIYKNLYNNLKYIQKSKGTEKSIRAVFRAFGVDDELLKIKGYTNSKYEIDGSRRHETVRRKNLLDLSGQTDAQNLYGSVFNIYTASVSGSAAYVTSSQSPGKSVFGFSDNFSIESTIIFPKKFDTHDSRHVHFPASDLTASLFGLYEVYRDLDIESPVTQWQSDIDKSDLGYKVNVFAVQRSRESKDAKFVFNATGRFDTILTESDWFENVYDNSKWTFALRLYCTGSQYERPLRSFPDSTTPATNFVFDIKGINELAGHILNTCSFSTVFTATNILSESRGPMNGNTGFYIGARRTNFSGTLLNPTQAKFAYFRVWNDYISDDDIINHALDAHNFGVSNGAMEKEGIYDSINTEDLTLQIPKLATNIINWEFENDYVPDVNGKFLVESLPQTSYYYQTHLQNSKNRFAVLSKNYTGLGAGFNANATVIDKNYVIEHKNRMIDDLNGYDEISVVDDELFRTKSVMPTEIFYTIESSIYAVISEEMLHFFSSIDDFNNLIGEPFHKYRLRYKLLDHLKNMFFSKIQNPKIDFDKYLSYYSWLDNSISQIVRNLIPLSAAADATVRTVIESHVLERNKHTMPLPLVREVRATNPIILAQIKNINLKKLIGFERLE